MTLFEAYFEATHNKWWPKESAFELDKQTQPYAEGARSLNMALPMISGDFLLNTYSTMMHDYD